MKISKLFKKEERADILVAGLGNPGVEYKNSPHNAGFEVLDIIYKDLKEQEKIETSEQTKQHNLFSSTINNKKILFVKPLTFVNHSGNVIKKIKTKYDIENENIWIIQDEVDLPFEKIRISFRSQDAGHNGIKNITEKLETKKFYRFRIGVMPEKNQDTTLFVTTPLPSPKKELFQKSLQECANLVIKSLQNGKPIK